MYKKLHIFINKFCNLKCKYCYWEGKYTKEEMSTDIIDRICCYINLNPKKYDYIVFFGGEPMLSNRIISRFINNINDNSMKYIIMTNGTINPSIFIASIKDIQNKHIKFTISYDGMYQDDRGKNISNIIEENIKYIQSLNTVSCTIGCIMSPYNYQKIPENMDKLLRLNDSGIFFRICNVKDNWKIDDLHAHIRSFHRIVHIGAFNTVCKEKQVLLVNRIDKLRTEDGDNKLGSKGNYCQKSLVNTDVIGIDGKKYLCEVAYAKNDKNYGYIWEDNDTIAVEYDKTHHNKTGHYCLYYGTECVEFDTAMEAMRNKFHEIKDKLTRLKEYKKTQLKTLSKNDNRLWNLYNHKNIRGN